MKSRQTGTKEYRGPETADHREGQSFRIVYFCPSREILVYDLEHLTRDCRKGMIVQCCPVSKLRSGGKCSGLKNNRWGNRIQLVHVEE